MSKNQSVAPISCSIKDFFNYWLVFTKPFHKLGNKEIKILSYLLYKRYELSKIINDDSLLDKYLFNNEIREEVRLASNCSKPHFQLLLTKLRKAGVLLDNNILNKRFIPDITDDTRVFNILYQFKIKND